MLFIIKCIYLSFWTKWRISNSVVAMTCEILHFVTSDIVTFTLPNFTKVKKLSQSARKSNVVAYCLLKKYFEFAKLCRSVLFVVKIGRNYVAFLFFIIISTNRILLRSWKKNKLCQGWIQLLLTDINFRTSFSELCESYKTKLSKLSKPYVISI